MRLDLVLTFNLSNVASGYCGETSILRDLQAPRRPRHLAHLHGDRPPRRDLLPPLASLQATSGRPRRSRLLPRRGSFPLPIQYIRLMLSFFFADERLVGCVPPGRVITVRSWTASCLCWLSSYTHVPQEAPSVESRGHAIAPVLDPVMVARQSRRPRPPCLHLRRRTRRIEWRAAQRDRTSPPWTLCAVVREDVLPLSLW
jgi:hypothetical protein